MANIRAQVALGSATNIPADQATNTYHFEVTNATAEVLDNILDLLEDLYRGTSPGTGLMQQMAADVCSGNYTIKLYDLGDSIPRAPVRERVGTRGPGQNVGLPSEVALCASFQGARISGEDQARRRGRVFIPFLGITTVGAGRPDTAIILFVGLEFTLFAAAAEASLSVVWTIWSPTNQEMVPVTDGWVDNAWDTQYRRGIESTERTVFPQEV